MVHHKHSISAKEGARLGKEEYVKGEKRSRINRCPHRVPPGRNPTTPPGRGGGGTGGVSGEMGIALQRLFSRASLFWGGRRARQGGGRAVSEAKKEALVECVKNKCQQGYYRIMIRKVKYVNDLKRHINELQRKNSSLRDLLTFI